MAAGLGFKTFTTGEVLTAADVNGYLMQGVLVFATEAARDAAITSPQEGQFAYTKDNNSLWYYTGSAWAASGATGDIEGVTAGVGISGGGTSGTVTITNSMATAIDAKGDLVVGTGADTFARLAVGTNGYTLVADSVETTGLKWVAPATGGGMTQLATGTLSGANVSITSISGSYRNLWLVIKNFRPAVDSDVLRMRVNNDTNSRYEYLNNNSANTFNNTWDDSFWTIATNTDDTTNEGITTVELWDYANTDTMQLAYWQNLGSNETTTANYNFTRGHLFYNQLAAINQIDLFAASGNMTAGTYILYGVS